MKLLIDSGNTRLKWAVLDQGELDQVNAVVHNDANALAELKNKWVELPPPEVIVISSVSRNTSQLTSLLVELWPNCALKFIQSPSMAHGVTNAYQTPSKLGVDRWLAIVAAKCEYMLPLCLVDCGTAITLDCIDAEGLHLGGMIMPGWGLMQQSLYKGTANLGVCHDKYPLGLANNTQAAIFNGKLAAIKGFIDSGMAGSMQLILTGGDAEFIQESLQLTAILDFNLVLKGLALEAI